MGWLAAGWATGAAAQTYFKWTDSQGVVHFSEAPPPPQTKGVEKLDMPGAPVRSRAVQPAPGATAPAGAPETPPGATAGTPAAARVVLTGRKTPRTGPAALQVSGEVKNVGGGNARDVTVTITVLDSSSGYECLRQEVPVAPATLGAGEVGTFDVDLDSPCLLGQPKLDLTPVWVSADQSE
jgi:hypothetical protein